MNKIINSNLFSDIIPEKVRNCFLDKQTEKDLADAFAIASNKFFLLADNEYDYEEGSKEYVEARAITDEWCALMNEYEEKILEILRSEGVIIPKTGRIRVLKPFMARNGYMDGTGWWIKA
ncbi:MAG: hypothetical protein IKW53_07015 [Clostridia bacterium]|nr:hypothetical protein [Clostridia bacterium]